MKFERRQSFYGIALVAAVVGVVRAADPVLTSDVPKRVEEYTSRVYQCIDWGGKLSAGANDPARAAIIARAIEALDCRNLHLETDYMQKHYNDYSPASAEVEVATRDWQHFQQSEAHPTLPGNSVRHWEETRQ